MTMHLIGGPCSTTKSLENLYYKSLSFFTSPFKKPTSKSFILTDLFKLLDKILEGFFNCYIAEKTTNMMDMKLEKYKN